ncbi:MAG TPA: sigma-70 family RNA polymerase sigma factor [Candidatus Limnocylindrales bacterium]|nr:sigma-70 family RNA polymerase sigma factor [Candidatus Limnocylindrales bacterium]
MGYSFNKMTDEELMAQVQRGDQAAFEELFKRYDRKIFNYFLRYLGDEELAKDLFQETFLRVFQFSKSYKPTTHSGRSSSFAAWLYTVARNVYRKQWGREPVEGRMGESTWEMLEEVPTPNATPQQARADQELVEKIKQALDALPESQREVVILHKYQGLSYPQIAQVLGCSISSVKQRAFRAYQSLRQQLAEYA